MYPNFHTHAPTLGVLNVLLFAHGPTIVAQTLVCLEHHVSHELPLFHESRTESLSTCPGLRTATVEVNTVDIRSNQG